MPDLTDDINDQVLEPLSSTADGQSATGRPIDDLIKVDNRNRAIAAAAKRRRGMMFSVFRTPGAGGYCGGESFDRPCGGC